MKPPKITNKLILAGAAILIGTICVGVGFWWFIASEKTHDTKELDVSLAAAAPFSFDRSAAPEGWFETIGGLAFSKMKDDRSSACHVSANYSNDGRDEATWVREKSEDQAGYTITPGKSVPLTLTTTHGAITYTLHQRTITPQAGVSPVKEGVAIGYADLPGAGYIHLTGICDKSHQLPEALIALQAFRVDTSKTLIDVSSLAPETIRQ